MRKEARNNFVFIVILLAVSVPGLVMLVKKKLSQSGSPQMGFSSPVRLEVPYVDPLPVGTETRLLYPPVLRGWVRSLSADAPLTSAWTSEHRSFELIGRSADSATLLFWDPRVKIDQARFTAGDQPASVHSSDRVSLPPPVVSELRQLGFLAPPMLIWRVELALPPGIAPNAVLKLDDGEFSDTLRLPGS